MKRGRNLLFKLIKPFGVLGVLFLLVWLGFQLNLFYVQSIDIVPFSENSFRFIDKETLSSRLLPYEGKRIFSVSTNEIEGMVTRSDPFVEKVYVTKRLPSTLIVRIEEKEPVAIVREGNINQIEQVLAGPILDSDSIVDKEGERITDCMINRSACVLLPMLIIPEKNNELTDNLVRGHIKSVFMLLSLLNDKKIAVLGLGSVENGVVVVSFKDATRGIFKLDDVERGIDDYLVTRESVVMEGRMYKEIDVRFDRPVVRVDKYSEWVIE